MKFLKIKRDYSSPFVLRMNRTELGILVDEILDSSQGETFHLEIVELNENEFEEFETIKTDYEMNSFGKYEDDEED